MRSVAAFFSIRASLFACAAALACGTAAANPTGATVANGTVNFSTAGATLTVTNSPGSIINWQGFSISAGELTRFIQQSSASSVLNRVVGVSPSAILGALQSNGRVFLVNPNGIVFGAGSQVDVGGLVATTLNLTDQNFLAGTHQYAAGPSAGSLTAAGDIRAQSSGVYLIAPNITIAGSITSTQGAVVVAAGQSVNITEAGVGNASNATATGNGSELTSLSGTISTLNSSLFVINGGGNVVGPGITTLGISSPPGVITLGTNPPTPLATSGHTGNIVVTSNLTSGAIANNNVVTGGSVISVTGSGTLSIAGTGAFTGTITNATVGGPVATPGVTVSSGNVTLSSSGGAGATIMLSGSGGGATNTVAATIAGTGKTSGSLALSSGLLSASDVKAGATQVAAGLAVNGQTQFIFGDASNIAVVPTHDNAGNVTGWSFAAH